jgi:hypothetical protein
MQTSLESPEPQEKRRLSLATFAIAAVAVLAVGGSIWFLLAPMPGQNALQPTATVNLRMQPAEQEYTKKIQVGNIALSRAENFLHQEVTLISGEVFNSGAESVSGLRLTADFSDSMNQVVLRESRAVLGSPEVPLAPGERRAFEISFEHVPSSWNMEQPAIRVSYLQLPSHK